MEKIEQVIFIDTNGVIATADKGDDFHKKAVDFWKKGGGFKVITSNMVRIETLGWVRYKLGKKKALEIDGLFGSEGGVEIIRMTLEDEKRGWIFFKKLDGRGASMVDCISMAMMKRLKIKNIFTFDNDFRKAGFRVLPE